MLRRRLRSVLPVLLVGAAVSAASSVLAQATPRSIGECERLKNDLAYNQCLAMFGPPARSVAGGDGAGGPPPVAYAPGAAEAAGIPSPDEPELAEPSTRGRRGRYGRRGRHAASFAVATAGDEVSESAAPRRSHRRRRRR